MGGIESKLLQYESSIFAEGGATGFTRRWSMISR
jgi:hypothetical protein